MIEHAWRWARRKPGTAALAAAAAGALVLAGVVGWCGYMNTINALEQESRRRGAAEIATRRAEDNVAVSLKVFEKLFESIAGEDHFPPPPLRRPGRGPQQSGRAERSRRPSPGWATSQEHVAFLQSVLEFYEQFARKNATNLKLEGEAACAYRKIGALYDRLGRTAEAEAAYARAFAMFEALIARFPGAVEYRAGLVETAVVADPWWAGPAALGRLEARIRRARELIDAIVADEPDHSEYALLQAHTWLKHGVALERLDRQDEAAVCYRQAIMLDTGLIDRSPDFDQPRLHRATAREALALLAMERNRRDDARVLLESVLDELRALSSSERIPPPMADRLERLGDAFNRLGDAVRAAQAYQLAEEAFVRRPPMPPEPRVPLARSSRSVSFRP